MMYRTYEIRHKRENKSMSNQTFCGIQMNYCNQWRDDDGSIPWDMFHIHKEFPGGPVREEHQIDPWTGEMI